MADYIYLLETRLTPAQQRAIATIRSVAREHEYTVFLTGGAVRDMTGGGSIRDLDLTVQGNALELTQALQAAGATIYGEEAAAQRLFLRLPGGVRAEVSSAMSVTFPKPGRPEYQSAALADDLRSRDFTANAMAVSLNEGSYGLLMDPLNGVADIENRELRLVSNYGFIEEPSRLIRGARLRSRLGWQFEERTGQRYDTAKAENYIAALSPWHRGYELEELFHEEDPVRTMRALEAEGFLTSLSPALAPGKANTAALHDVAERQGQLQMQGLFAQSAALTFPLVTAKASADEVIALKEQFVRRGFVEEIDTLEAKTREFATRFGGKDAALPSAAWHMLREAEPNLILSMAYSSKTSSSQGRLKTFLNDSPTARQRIPYVLMQEMRITPDLPVYDDLVEKLFFELMDNKLSTTEEIKAYLEPYSPPAPPPPVNLRRARAKKEARPGRAKSKKAVEANELPSVAGEEEATGVELGLMEPGTLTGPNRGPEPSPREPLAGKEAPEPTRVVRAKGPEHTDGVAQSKTVPMKKVKPGLAPASQTPAPVENATRPVVANAPTKKGKPAPEAAGKVDGPRKALTSDARTAAATSEASVRAPGKSPVKQASAKQVAVPAKQAAAKAVTVPPKGKSAQSHETAKSVPGKLANTAKAAPEAKVSAKTVASPTSSSRSAAKASGKVASSAKTQATTKKAAAPVVGKAPLQPASKAQTKVAAKAAGKKTTRR